jgi:hypothetical protein
VKEPTVNEISGNPLKEGYGSVQLDEGTTLFVKMSMCKKLVKRT